MAIDKALYEAPQGIDSLATSPDIEIEVVNPEGMTVSADGVEIDLAPGAEDDEDDDFAENLAEILPDSYLATLSSELVADYDADVNARKDWLDMYVRGLDLLGLKYEERTEPWPGACGVTHPLLMESAVRFESETIMETFPASGPVKTVILGKETAKKKEASIRVADDMNYELTEGMPEYRPEHERMLMSLNLSGNAFKKVYYDPSLGRQVSMFVPSEDLVVPYGASSLASTPRATHVMRKTKNEVRKLQVAEFYRDVELGEPVRVMTDIEKAKAKKDGTASVDVDDRYQLLEIHADLDIQYEGLSDENGIALPYVVTIEHGTGTVLAVRRNWNPDDKLKQKRQHFVHYGYIPGFGFYYFGLIHLIGGHATAATSLMRQLVDCGTLSNLPGGLKSKGLRVKGDDTPIGPGEFRDVDVPSGSIRDNIMMLPYKEPSQVLVALMDKVVDDARRFAAAADLKVSDMSAQSPVGTTLAILERTLKVMSAVQARIHYAMKQEFKLLAAIIRDNTPEDYSYEPEVGGRKAKRADYSMVDVIPVSDPNAATMSQRVVQYQAVQQLSQTAPQIYDLQFLHRQMIEVLGVKNANKIIPMPGDMKPMDPVTENMQVMMGKPVKAFIFQDHEAHLAVHMAAMKDPKLAAMLGQNPQAQALQAAAMAHIMEHVAFQYRKEIEKQLGAALPPMPDDSQTEDEGEPSRMSHEMEAQLAQLVAQAAQQLLQQNQSEAQKQQAQQQAQDPLVQMQQQELKIKEAEVERKAKKDTADAAAKADEIRLKEAEMEFKQESKMADVLLKMSDSGAQREQNAQHSQFQQQQHAQRVQQTAEKKPQKKGKE